MNKNYLILLIFIEVGLFSGLFINDFLARNDTTIWMKRVSIMTGLSSIMLGLNYQIGDSVIINSQEWIIAKEFNGNVLLFRNSIDEHSRTMKFSKKDLKKKMSLILINKSTDSR